MNRRVAVVGGGLTGLTTAWALRDDADVVVLEAADRLGGQIRTRRLAGSVIDVGADAFLARQPEADELARTLGLGDELVAPATGEVSLWVRGRRRRLPPGTMMGAPSSLSTLMRTGVLPWAGVARAALEPFVRVRTGVDDCSVAALVGQRFGDDVVECLVEPLLGGVYAGDPARLSARAATPPLWDAATGGGSLLRQLARARLSAPTSAGPVFRTVAGGLERIVDRLAGELGDAVRIGARVRDVAFDGRGWRLVSDGAATQDPFDAVVLALPAHIAGALLAGVAPESARRLCTIRAASVAVVSLAYPWGAAVDAIPGSGVLVPRREGRLVKAVTISSRKWPHLADADRFLLRASVGRIDDHAWHDFDDAELTARVDEEVRELVGLHTGPDASLVTRWEDALPQYEVGHLDAIASIRASLPEGLFVGGAAFGGVGLPSRVRDARRLAEQVREHFARG